MSLLSRLRSHLTTTTGELEAADLKTRTGALGTTPVAELEDRQEARISGVVRALASAPAGRVPALIADIYDGSGTCQVVWLGRREIRGIDPGRYLRVQGRVSMRKGRPVIVNAAYEILPHAL